MTERPILFSGLMVRAILDGTKTQTRRVVKYKANAEEGSTVHPHECPFGPVGTCLWVRETWKTEALSCSTPTGGPDEARYYLAYKADVGFQPRGKCVIFPKLVTNAWQRNRDGWRPSIHMPRWASRLTLEIASVRVERLQSMTFNDWVADFCPSSVERESALATFVGDANRRRMAKDFWDSINAKRGFGWDKNPWVWVISFKRVG